MDDTTLVLADMMTEHTGRHMCDSGGYGRRHWEKYNGKKAEDFLEADPITLEVSSDLGFSITFDLFHFLKRVLIYDEKLDQKFEAFLEVSNRSSYLKDMRAFPDWLDGKTSGYFGSDPLVDNTANFQTFLDQDFQYIAFYIEGELVVGLQVHGGADIRGGYTRPRFFRGEEDITGYRHASLNCHECRSGWWTDDTHHWYGDPDLEEFDKIDHYSTYKEDDPIDYSDQKEMFDDEEIEEGDSSLSLLVMNHQDDDIYCPFCGPPHQLEPER